MTTEPAAGQVLRWFQLLKEGQCYGVAHQMSQYSFPTAVEDSVASGEITEVGKHWDDPSLGGFREWLTQGYAKRITSSA